MPISAILNQTEQEKYRAELDKIRQEQQALSGLQLKDPQLEQDALNISALFVQYDTNNTKKRPVEEAVEKHVVTPGFRLAWHLLLGAGVILQETVAATTKLLSQTLFPANFVMDGLRSLWDLYRTIRDKSIAQRKTKLGVNVVHLAGLAAGSVVVALAVTNPFALPVIFLTINLAGLYRNAYVLDQTKQLLKKSKDELLSVQNTLTELRRDAEILELKSQEYVQVRIARLEAQQARLETQIGNLEAKRSELRREMFFNALTVLSVGLLVTGAALSIIFPPASALVTTAGLFLFGATVIANVLSSPPVVAKYKQAVNWFKSVLGVAEAVEVTPAPTVKPSPLTKLAAANEPVVATAVVVADRPLEEGRPVSRKSSADLMFFAPAKQTNEQSVDHALDAAVSSVAFQ